MNDELDQFTGSEVTALIDRAANGDKAALGQLAPLVYPDLKMIAAGIRRKHFGASLNTTALVNEAWIRLERHGVHVNNRKHFFCVAAQAMRQILVNAAASSKAAKRSGQPVTLRESAAGVEMRAEDLLLIDQVLDHLQQQRPRLCDVFQLRYFLGMTENEVADVLELTNRTVRRDWLVVKKVVSDFLQVA